MYIERQLSPAIRNLSRMFPIVAVTGPRQSGKTTLVKHEFSSHPYVSLEDPDEMEYANADPRGFLDRFSEGAIFDEAQRAPKLFNYLQSITDAKRKMGRYVLTGSSQFSLVSGITQSLSGRVGAVTLLPFSVGELLASGETDVSLEDLLVKGFYPPLYDRGIDSHTWYSNYVSTYVERDVRQLINIRDLRTFQAFLRVCASRSGRLINMSSISQDIGISHNTVRAWLSILEASYIIYFLTPYLPNIAKRQVKTPKMHFIDTGLLSWLLGIRDPAQIDLNPMKGQLFESFAVSELLKSRFNRAEPSDLCFYRDTSGLEVDVILERGTKITPIEIKSSRTMKADLLRGVEKFSSMAGDATAGSALIYAGDESRKWRETDIISWRDIGSLA